MSFRWIKKLVYVCNPVGLGDDYLWMILKDGIEPNNKIQLAYNNDIRAIDISKNQQEYYATAIHEPEVEFNIIRNIEGLNYNGKFQEAVEYKATQIPTRLIKYYGLNENEIINKSKMEYLKEQKIYLSSFSGFNDPFEGKFFRFDSAKLENYGWNKDMVKHYYDSIAGNFRYTCLSDTDENNMPMWTYYANNHQGFCVEYLLCDTQKKYIFPVTYEPERVAANVITTNLLYEYMEMKEQGRNYTDTSSDANVYLQMMILSLAAKHKSWEHEKELIDAVKDIDVCKMYQTEIDEDSSEFGFNQNLIG